MPMRLGPGPVFVYEWLTASRRPQLYATRAGFVGAILVGLAFMSYELTTHRYPGATVPLRELAEYGQSIYLTIALIELALVLLAAPATTAGAVCLDRARGTLDHMLATDLSNAEIVLGKLFVRLIPVLGLIACLLPVVALASLMGGIEPTALAGSFLTSIGCAVLGCSLAMTLSVWGRKTHEVLIATYMILVAWLIAPGPVAIAMYELGLFPPPFAAPAFWQFVIDTHPYYLVCAPYLDPGKVDLTTYLGFLIGCLVASLGLVGLSTWRIRRVAQEQAGRPSVGARRGWPRWRRPWWLPAIPGPSLDANPVAWREWHRARPTRMARVAWGLYGAMSVLGVAWAFAADWGGDLVDGLAPLVGIQAGVGYLLLSVQAATGLAEERARGRLDVLLSTPMSTRSILVGKWWGTFRQAGRVAFWPAVLGGLLVLHGGSGFHYLLLLGSVAAHVAAIASLGLAMATWVSRPGRAVAACASIYVAGSAVWVAFVVLLCWDETIGPSLIIGCPAIEAYAGTFLIGPESRSPEVPEYRFAAAFWIGAYLAMAAGLFGATVASFDRRLGRMPGDDVPTRSA